MGGAVLGFMYYTGGTSAELGIKWWLGLTGSLTEREVLHARAQLASGGVEDDVMGGRGQQLQHPPQSITHPHNHTTTHPHHPADVGTQEWVL